MADSALSREKVPYSIRVECVRIVWVQRLERLQGALHVEPMSVRSHSTKHQASAGLPSTPFVAEDPCTGVSPSAVTFLATAFFATVFLPGAFGTGDFFSAADLLSVATFFAPTVAGKRSSWR
jgi:hypothetical protein